MKRQISLVAALIMLITTVFSNTVFASFSDVAEDNRYRNAIITLSKLGVIDGYDDGTFKPEGQITRAEFTKMLIAALGFGNNTTEPTEFDDVTGHWARTYIKTAYDMKIINGTGERTFEPDKPVTYEQALKMIVCSLGYEVMATAKGGYPQGFLTVASDLSLDANVVNQANSDPAARQVIAQAVYNALEVEMQEKNQLGIWEGADKTILEDYLKVIKLTGTLVGVEDTRTNDSVNNLIRNQIAMKPSSAAFGTEEIVINLGEYKDHTVGELAKLVGNEMTVYYSQGDDASERELKILDYETTNNEVKTIDYKKFAGYDSNTFKYTDGPSRKNLKIKDTVTVIYNGQAVSDVTSVVVKDRLGTDDKAPADMEDLLGMWLGTNESYSVRGDATFTDTGADGTVDIISINDYKTMVALKAPSTTDYRIQNLLKTGDSMILNPNDVNKKIYIEKDGKEIEATSIRANDVISYTESIDGAIINVYVVNETVKGTVNSMNTTDGTITIANEEYDLGENCVDYIKNKEGKDLQTGVSGTFYVDKLGAVVYGKLDTVVADPYAYISGVTEDPGEGIIYVSMYMPGSSKGVTSYQLSDKAEVNGNKVETVAELQSVLGPIAAVSNRDTADKNLYDDGAAAENIDWAQPVRVKLNSAKDTIMDIYTIDTSADVTGKQNEDSTKLALYRELANYYYTGSSFKTSSSGSAQFTVNSKTTVLYVPRDRSAKTGYSKKTVSNAFKSGNKYWVEAYDVNKSNVASLVILYGDNAQLNNITDTTHFSVVAKTPDESYDDATSSTTKSVSVFTNSTTAKSWMVKPNNTEFDNVQPGDIIQFAYDDENKIQGLRSIIKYADIAAVLEGAAQDITYPASDDGTYAGETRSEKYNWNATQTQTEDNFWQKYVYDYRHPKEGASAVDNYFVTYSTSNLGIVPKSRACVYNIYQLIENESGTINKLYLTKEGFTDKTLRSSEVLEYDEVAIGTGTQILRMENTGSDYVFSPYAEGTETKLAATDFEAADQFGEDCSKAMVFTQNGTARLIVLLPR